MKFESLDIVVPVYNEAGNIKRTLQEIEAKVTTRHRVYIIYDSDEDDTLPVVEDFIRERGTDNIFLLRNKYGKGVLNAIKTGFDLASGEVILVVMADCSDDLSVADLMFQKINEGYDLVCGSRYMKGGRQIGGPWFKKLLSKSAGVSLHILTGVPTHDVTNSYKMYRKSVLRELSLESRGGFEIGMEVTVKAFLRGCRITEVPCIWRDRTAGKSRFKFRQWLPGYIRWYLYAVATRLKQVLWIR